MRTMKKTISKRPTGTPPGSRYRFLSLTRPAASGYAAVHRTDSGFTVLAPITSNGTAYLCYLHRLPAPRALHGRIGDSDRVQIVTAGGLRLATFGERPHHFAHAAAEGIREPAP